MSKPHVTIDILCMCAHCLPRVLEFEVQICGRKTVYTTTTSPTTTVNIGCWPSQCERSYPEAYRCVHEGSLEELPLYVSHDCWHIRDEVNRRLEAGR